MPGEVALCREKWRSCREKWRSPVISATERQGLGMAMNSYFSTSHGKPGIVAALSSATSWIRTHQEPGIPGSWITRMMLTPSVDSLPKGSRVQATSCARRHCSQTQSLHCNTVSLNRIKSILKKVTLRNLYG
jgi:hypothetical protein